MPGSPLEERLLWQIAAAGLPAPVREYRFAPPRRWRFDLAWPDRRVAVEVEGGTWTWGRHVRGGGYRQDVDKYNAAVRLGWAVFRVTADMVRDGSALALLESVLTLWRTGEANGARGERPRYGEVSDGHDGH